MAFSVAQNRLLSEFYRRSYCGVCFIYGHLNAHYYLGFISCLLHLGQHVYCFIRLIYASLCEYVYVCVCTCIYMSILVLGNVKFKNIEKLSSDHSLKDYSCENKFLKCRLVYAGMVNYLACF